VGLGVGSTASRAAIAGTSSNSNGAAALGQTASGFHDPSQMQAVLDRLIG